MLPDSRGGTPVDYAVLSDEQLVARLKDSDGTAFTVLYERLGALVFSTSLRVLGDVTAAEDITQEVFLRLWRQPDSFDAMRGRFVTWLLSVTRNRAVDELRSRGRRQRREEPLPEMFDRNLLAADSADPAWSAQLAEERRAVRAALATLPPEQRLAIEMAYFKGMTQQEIASELGQPLGTVKTRIRLGMQKLKATLVRE